MHTAVDFVRLAHAHDATPAARPGDGATGAAGLDPVDRHAVAMRGRRARTPPPGEAVGPQTA